MFRRREKPKEIRFGRCRLIYRQFGSGPPLLLVHGLAGSGGWWRRNRPTFAKHFTVYVIDLVGYGGNRAWRPLRISETAGCLAEFIAGLPGGCAHVVAHSMGGQICTHLAGEYPERVNRLVLAAASGLLRSDLLRMMLRLPSAARYSRLDFAPTLAFDSLRSGPVNLLLSTLDILSDDVSDSLGRVVAPTLLLWGDRDTLVPLSVAEAVHRALPTSHLSVIPRAGHVLMWDQPEEFNRRVLEFLAEAGPQPSAMSPQPSAISRQKPEANS